MEYKRHINWLTLPENHKILQIYSKGLEYSLVSSNYEQCHAFVWCKDFLHDVIYATIHNRWFEVYKFKYNPEVLPTPCLSKTRLLLTNSKDKKFSQKIPAVIDFINQIEDKLDIKKTVSRQCSDPPEGYEKAGVFLFEGSKRWIQAPPMLSLYSLLLRIGFCHTLGDSFENTIEGVKSGKIKPYQRRDNCWLKSVEPALQKIMRLGDRRIFHKNIKINYPVNMQIDMIHNRLGVIGFAADINLKDSGHSVLVPHWHFQN